MFEGSYDPAIALGPLPFNVMSDRNASRTILVTGLGHAEDSFGVWREPKGVKPNLDVARDMKLQYLKQCTGLGGS
jgi:hypothetical protein